MRPFVVRVHARQLFAMYNPTLATKRLTTYMDTLRRQWPDLSAEGPPPDASRLAHIESAWQPNPTDWKKGDQVRALTLEEQKIVLVEIMKCKASFRYWLEHYAKIKDKDGRSTLVYPLLDSQEFMLKRMGDLEWQQTQGSNDGVLMAVLKARQMGACLDPKTRVLTRDLRWVCIDTLKVGDELVGVDEFPRSKSSRSMRPTTVEAIAHVFEPVVKLTLSDGTVLKATPNHRFLSRKRGGADTQWRYTKDFVLGDVIRGLCPVWEEELTFEDGWMAGMLDGEGSMSLPARMGAAVTVCQVEGSVLDRMHRYFTDRGYHYRVDIDRREPGTSSKFGTKNVHKICLSRMSELFKLMGRLRPSRFAGRDWWEGRNLPGKKIGADWREIVSIEHLPPAHMIDIQTGTKTFIAEGVVSHNSTLTELAALHRGSLHGNRYTLIAADVEEQSANLFNMTERALRGLPWWMRPRITNHVKDTELNFGDIDSLIRVTFANTTRGGTQIGMAKGQMGRGATVHTFHGSEMSTWTNAGQVDDALMPAIPISHNTLAVLESTARGRNWWHRTWLSAVSGQSRWHACFIPWYAEPRYAMPAPATWSASEMAVRHAQAVQRDSPRWCGRTVTLTRDQLYFWERKYLAAQQERTLYKFLAEYASNDEECFSTSDDGFFPGEVLMDLRGKEWPAIANVVYP